MKLERSGITKGMKEDALLGELRGRVSGETQLEAQQILAPKIILQPTTEGGKPKEFPAKFEVLDANEEYALIRKHSYHGLDANLKLLEEHFLAGITDEGKYFLRALDYSQVQDKPLDAIVDWINRVDEGYVHRVQGDVLIQFLPFAHREVRSYAIDPLSFDRLTRQMRIEDVLKQIEGPLILGQGQGRNNPWRSALSFFFTGPGGQRWGFQIDHNHQRVIGINLGNHRLSTDGAIFSMGDGIVFVDGDELTLQHYQHGIKQMQIPKAHYALITGQRGRTLTATVVSQIAMPGVQTLGGFD